MRHALRHALCLSCIFIFIFTTEIQAHALTSPSKFVRTANYFLLSGESLDEALLTLATFDLIVLPVEAQVYNKNFFKEIRDINKDIIILAYTATVSWNDLYWSDPLHEKMYASIQDNWWLRDENGKQISVWPGTRALNLNSGWSEFLPKFVKESVLSTGLWDGIFYDEVQDSISWVGKVDVSADGKNDSAQLADSLWEQKYQELFALTRTLIGKKFIVITNGSSNPKFAPQVNGRMFETFPSTQETLTSWENATQEYLTLEQTAGFEPVHVINVNTNNTGKKNDFQKVRFGITTTLLGNGYFGFDYGTQDHAQLWMYDEYHAYLGAPKSRFQNTLNPQKTEIDTGVWMREFEQGQVMVNATASSQTIELNGEFEKLHGTQDPNINNGTIVSDITLASQDGIILLRPIEKIRDATFVNGSFARVFTQDGKTKRTGFFAYDRAQRGGTQMIQTNINTDSAEETIVSDATFVSIFSSKGRLLSRFAPYTAAYNRGVNITVADLEDDGSKEIITGTENGGGAHVRIFNAQGTLINPGFFAYAKSFRGGVNVSVGDLNADGINEIICGAGYEGGPHVRVFRKDGTLINPGFFAYDKSFRGGVNVAVGDVDGDGVDEIITGPGRGGSPLARVFDRNGILKSEFSVFDRTDSDGLEVIATDVDGDGVDEIIGLSTDVFTLSGF